ncbi:MAG: mechanosensitive ion channel family protein [Candidatus Pacearchaeota archaeon]
MGLEQYIQNDYLRAIIIGIVILVFARVFVFVSFKVAKYFTGKTKTNIDDIIMQKAAKPLTILIFLFAIEIPLAELPLSEDLAKMISKIMLSVAIIILSYLIYSLFDLIIVNMWERFVKKSKTKVDDTLTPLINGILKIIILVLAFIYIFDLWGFEIGPLLAGLGIAGLAVALALQPTLGNIFSGISLILDKSIKIGDWVYLDANTRGIIERIGLRSTRIKTFDNELIIIPNTKLADSQIQNVALPEPKSRVVVTFSVAYGSDIDKVKKLVLKEIKSIQHIEDDPEPIVRFVEMGQSSLNFKVYFFVDSFENRWIAIDEANTKIYNALNKAGITIPFPQIDVHLKKEKE